MRGFFILGGMNASICHETVAESRLNTDRDVGISGEVEPVSRAANQA